MVRLRGAENLTNGEKLGIFQFRHGAIKSRAMIHAVLPMRNFNSDMVRLRV